MASAHVIEVEEVTAGIVVLEPGGFRFFASGRPFQTLEGALFRTLDQATRAARERWSRKGRITCPECSRVGQLGTRVS